ncbi:Spermatogenesis-associated protein 16 [Triplophysa tibetana]|uniref:Spermatogenesis-associated protein 16 n=1 Tax=Triplophysa tibetana TaxID=1572043 RepID=A0A5A9NH64_9TELE|nr:Spermatogenesis-associated protein 16 [Triplophysa tibetana]
MNADYIYWLSGDNNQHMSKLIKLYWQLLALMADTMDTLEGKRSDQERVWNALQKFIMHIEAFEILFEAPWKLLMVFASLFTTMCLNALNLPPNFVEARPDCRLSKGSLVEL